MLGRASRWLPKMDRLRSRAMSSLNPRTWNTDEKGGSSFEELLEAGSTALQQNQLGIAIVLLTRACATDGGQRSSFALGKLCNALIWDGQREASNRVADAAVRNGIWDSAAQRPFSYTRGLPTTPFPDPVALGYPEVREAMDLVEEAVRRDLKNFKDDVNICFDAREAPEGLQDPAFGSWEYTKINFSGTIWSIFGPWGGAQFPALSKILREVQKTGKIHIESAGVSTIHPGAIIRPHCGNTNTCWDIHVGLSVPERSASHLIVAGIARPWDEAKALLFDDSFEHQVSHFGKFPRSILDIVIRHPELHRTQRSSVA